MKITTDWLQKRDACANQVAVFTSEWPDGADLTAENIRRAAALSLDIDWLALHVLTIPARDAYQATAATAWEAFDAAIILELDALNAGIKAEWEAYYAARSPTRKAYDGAIRPAWNADHSAASKAYYAACNLARKARDAACAEALIDALAADNITALAKSRAAAP